MTAPHDPKQPSPEKQALISAFDEVLKADAEQREKGQSAPRPAPRRRLLHPVASLSLLVLLAVGVYLGVTRPDWLFARGVPQETTAIQEASLRLAMSMQFQRIERFRNQSGRLPTTIEEAGPPVMGIRYQARHPDGFTLTGTSGGVTLTLESTESLEAFVGNSYAVIERRGQ